MGVLKGQFLLDAFHIMKQSPNSANLPDPAMLARMERLNEQDFKWLRRRCFYVLKNYVSKLGIHLL